MSGEPLRGCTGRSMVTDRIERRTYAVTARSSGLAVEWAREDATDDRTWWIKVRSVRRRIPAAWEKERGEGVLWAVTLDCGLRPTSRSS